MSKGLTKASPPRTLNALPKARCLREYLGIQLAGLIALGTLISTRLPG